MSVESKHAEYKITPEEIFHAARFRDDATFNALVESADPDVINQFLLIRCSAESSGFQVAVCRNPAIFLTLLTKASTEVINQALLQIDDSSGFTGLHSVCRHLDSATFSVLLAIARSNVINQALLVNTNIAKRTAFHLAARYLDPITFIALLDKVSPAVISQGLSMKDRDGCTVFYAVARYQTFVILQILLDSYPFLLGSDVSKLIEIFADNPKLTQAERDKLALMVRFINDPKDSIRNHPEEFVEYLSNKVSHGKKIHDHEKWMGLLKGAISYTVDAKYLDQLYAMLGIVYLGYAFSHSKGSAENYEAGMQAFRSIKNPDNVPSGLSLQAGEQLRNYPETKNLGLRLLIHGLRNIDDENAWYLLIGTHEADRKDYAESKQKGIHLLVADATRDAATQKATLDGIDAELLGLRERYAETIKELYDYSQVKISGFFSGYGKEKSQRQVERILLILNQNTIDRGSKEEKRSFTSQEKFNLISFELKNKDVMDVLDETARGFLLQLHKILNKMSEFKVEVELGATSAAMLNEFKFTT